VIFIPVFSGKKVLCNGKYGIFLVIWGLGSQIMYCKVKLSQKHDSISDGYLYNPFDTANQGPTNFPKAISHIKIPGIKRVTRS
jgi:hypothetical protein